MRTVELPELHPDQERARAAAHLKRFFVLNCGRRWGKTTFGLDYLIGPEEGEVALLSGAPCAWFAPTFKLLGDVWREAKRTLAPIITGKDEQDKRLEIATGGKLEFWTLDVDDPARGRKYARVFVDEAAMVRNLEDKWNQAIRPTLTDFRGSAVFGSTPKGRNFFQTLADRHKEPGRTGWGYYHAPSANNPHLDPQEIEDARLDLPELVFRQEYLGQFVDFAGVIIRGEWIQHGPADPDLDTVVGVDLAISTKETAAYTALVAMSRAKRSGKVFVRGAQRFRAPFWEIIQRIEAFAKAHKAVKVCIEEVQFQAAVVQELLRKTKLNVRGIRPDKDKLTRFMPLAARYERGMVVHDENLPAYYAQELLALPEPDFWDLIDASSIAYAGLPSGPSVASAGKRTF